MEWISVKDSMPDNGEVIVYAPDGTNQIKELVISANCIGNRFYTGYYSNSISGVTHWMPLPNPPKE